MLLNKPLLIKAGFTVLFIILTKYSSYIWAIDQSEQQKLEIEKPVSQVPPYIQKDLHDRILGHSRDYLEDKVLFIANIEVINEPTNSKGKFEAFLADVIDGDERNLVRLSVGGARQVGWAFEGRKIFINTPSALIFYNTNATNRLHEITSVEQVCISPDKKNIGYIKKIEYSDQSAYKNKSLPYYSIYIMGEDFVSKKIIDLPTWIRPGPHGKVAMSEQEIYDSRWIETPFYLKQPMEWTKVGVSFDTLESQIGTVLIKYIYRKYVLDPANPKLKKIAQSVSQYFNERTQTDE